MENLNHKKDKPTKRDQILLDYYSNCRLNEEGKEKTLPKTDLQKKRDIWSLNKMENLVRNDETLTNRYNDMAIDGPFKFGYHWNEVIMNILFNEYVLSDRTYLERYLNTKEIEKKRRGNPDRKIDDTDFVDYDAKKKYKRDKKSKKMKKDDHKDNKVKKEGIDETTTSASSGQYLTPHAFAKDNKNWRHAKGNLPGVPHGTVVIPTLNESEDYLINPLMFEEFIKNLEEEKRHSALILKDRLGKENEKNFKKDLSLNKQIEDAVKDAKEDSKTDKVKSLQDLEDEQLKEKEFKPVKYEVTDEATEAYRMKRKGMEDLKYDVEPSEKFKERAKEHMGEELYEKGQERIEKEKGQPLYNKDAQPVVDEKEFTKKFNESVKVSGKYIDGFNKSKFVDFRLDESIYSENINSKFIKLNMSGVGNSYTNKVELNESVKKILDDTEFYYDLNEDIIYHTEKQNINEEINLGKFKHLSGYNPKSYTSPKKYRK
jgi:hypothetical protein